MHGIGAHSALAIKRQRRRRVPSKARRGSQQQGDHYESDNKVMGTVTMFHVGAVFLLLAAFLILGALLTSESRKETAELVGTGVICLIIGLFLVVLNRFYGQREEDDLANYVEQRLGRSRSGQRLYHEQESMPEHLGAGPSASASMESDMSRDFSRKSKGNKKSKKNKNKDGNRGIEETAVNGSDPKVKVDVVNEHHQYLNNTAATNDITSSANITLDRIAEEVDQQYHNQPISYVNANYEDGISRASNNLYRVYDRESSYTRAGGAV